MSVPTDKNGCSAVLRPAAALLLQFCVPVFFISFSAAEISPVIGADGLLALSNGAPLSSYRMEPELAARYHAMTDPCIREWQNGGPTTPVCSNATPAGAMAMAFAQAEKRIAGGNYPSGLTPEEAAGLMYYTGDSFGRISRALWRKELPDARHETDIVMLTLSGLNKMPDYRGLTVRSDFYSHTPGKEELEARVDSYRKAMNRPGPYTPKSFWSASRIVEGFPGSAHQLTTALVLYIESRTGKYLGHMSYWPNEMEILFRPGAAFEVLKIEGPLPVPKDRNSLGYQYIVRLRELP